eukprot:scaffold7096_cov253-Pinguiococcus_pyrenoidosus.AAC.2
MGRRRASKVLLASTESFPSLPPRCPERQAGNYGRWNFNGGGPEVRPVLSAGSVGAVMSLPGCADQALHADAPHLYDHVHLPPYYVNLFVPAVADEGDTTFEVCIFSLPASAAGPFAEALANAREASQVGQTAFIPASHVMDACARLMDDANRSERLEQIVRPHLKLGDAILFDTRIIHFGLANRSSRGTRRPVLYVNYTQPWYEDKKNWERSLLFGDGGDQASRGE